MSIRIAVATSDGKNVDLHFGKADRFQIYELQNGKFVFLEERKAASSEYESREKSSAQNCGTDGNGCGSGGNCGQKSGCGGGGIESPNVALLSDCAGIVAAKFGQQIIRQFERKAVSIFDIECPVDFALEKLAAYYNNMEKIKH